MKSYYEKRIKKWKCEYKENIINEFNPSRTDLWWQIIGEAGAGIYLSSPSTSPQIKPA